MRVLPVVVGLSWFFFVVSVSYAVNSATAPPRSRITVERHAIPLPPPRPSVEPSAPTVPGVPAETPDPPISSAELSEPLPTSEPQSEPAPRTAELSPEPPAPADPPEPVRSPVAVDWRRKSDTRSASRPVASTGSPLAAALPAVPAPAFEAPPIPEKKRRASRRASAAPAAEIPEIPGEPMGVCMICGARADSWTEVDGQRIGYCRKHLTKAAPVPPAPREAASESPDEPRLKSERRTAPAETGSASAQCQGFTKSGTRCRRKTSDPSGLCYQHRGQARF